MAPLQERVALGLGWTELQAFRDQIEVGVPPGQPAGSAFEVVPDYEHDMAAAWACVEALQKDGYGWDLWVPNSAGFQRTAQVYNDSDEWTGEGDTMPEAICAAYLAAKAAQGERAGA